MSEREPEHMEREVDPTDVGRQTAEIMLQDALDRQKAEAKNVLPPKGTCWNCDEPLEGGIEGGLRFCMDYDDDGKPAGSSCMEDYQHRKECRVRNGK